MRNVGGPGAREQVAELKNYVKYRTARQCGGDDGGMCAAAALVHDLETICGTV